MEPLSEETEDMALDEGGRAGSLEQVRVLLDESGQQLRESRAVAPRRMRGVSDGSAAGGNKSTEVHGHSRGYEGKEPGLLLHNRIPPRRWGANGESCISGAHLPYLVIIQVIGSLRGRRCDTPLFGLRWRS